jgi:poly-gamma-glutamate synthesis protein (capsule biosynthesis protein)
VDAQSADAQPADAQPADVQSADAQSADAQPDEVLLTISAAGDVTHGGDRRRGRDLFAAELKRQGGDLTFAFRNVKALFDADDLTIVNYEGALTASPPVTENTYCFAGHAEYAQALTLGGIEAVALDNNHVFDHGKRGYADTQQAMAAVGVAYSGDGQRAIYVVQGENSIAQGARVGMLSYCTLRSGYAAIRARVAADIQSLRDQGCALVVVSYHWGEERAYTPSKKQIDLGHATIDAGADLVLGHHSHVINPIERYQGRYICYSLANFSFAGNANPSDKDTFIFQQRFRLTPDGALDAGMRIVPCRVSSVPERNDFIPTPYDPDDARRVAEKLTQLGAGMEHALTAYPLAW